MKAKLAVLVLVLALSAGSYADYVIGDFEGGSNDTWWVGWGTTLTPVEGNATLGTGSMQAQSDNGGWVLLMELALRDQPNAVQLQSAISTVGLVSVDVTALPVADADWAELALMVNCGGEWGNLWNTYSYHSIALDGSTQTVVFELPGDAMTALADSNWWANIGILSNSGETQLGEPDPITGEQEVIWQGGVTHYFDNVQVIVPEPATLSLLGLGALSLIRRKR